MDRTPTGALNLNVEGHHLAGALQGFGQMWQKTFRVRLQGADVTPGEVIKTWKERFGTFWPDGNRFYAPLTGIAPGEVGLINMRIPGDSPIGLPLSTGVLVIYADEESFTFITLQEHVFAGWITFSAFEEEGCTVAQVQVLLRAFDFAYELGFRLGASKSENRFWEQTLLALAAHFGVDESVRAQVICIDARVQGSQFWNIWQNSTHCLVRTWKSRRVEESEDEISSSLMRARAFPSQANRPFEVPARHGRQARSTQLQLALKNGRGPGRGPDAEARVRCRV